MWYPKSWPEVQALIGSAEETTSLDFKRELSSNAETAKDIAAMTVNGGAVLIGIEEDKKTRTAASIRPQPLAGIEERLRQIAGTNVAPTPDFQVHCIPEPTDQTKGVIAVVVPPSSLAPHQCGNRYPYRSGTTTYYLDEKAVERLYRQRQELSGAAPQPDQLLQDSFVSTLNDVELRGGRVMLVIRPAVAEARHPAGAWQRKALRETLYNTNQRLDHHLANTSMALTPNAIAGWQPLDTRGWYATNAHPARVAPVAESPAYLIGATLTYPACLSFDSMWGLEVPAGHGRPAYRCAREVDVARELIVMLAFAGEYFSGVEGGSFLLARVVLQGFARGKSQFYAETAQSSVADLPDAPANASGAIRTSAAELREDPVQDARLLIDHWLPSFFRDPYPDQTGDRDLLNTISGRISTTI